ncbi:MAG: hypothetical protein P8Y37_07775 [Anaerolineales bacterium]
MDSVFEFLNQPLIITIVSLVIGSYAISLITEKRARQNKLRDQAVEFITQAGNNINQFLPLLYSRLRTGRIRWDQTLDDALTELFTKRMWVQIGSQAYLRSEAFYQRYYQMLDEIMKLVQKFHALEQEGEGQPLAEEIRSQRESLVRAWPLENEDPNAGGGGATSELIAWLDAILHRVTALLVEHLDAALGKNL